MHNDELIEAISKIPETYPHVFAENPIQSAEMCCVLNLHEPEPSIFSYYKNIVMLIHPYFLALCKSRF